MGCPLYKPSIWGTIYRTPGGRLLGAFLHVRSAGCTSTAIDDEHRPAVETPKNLWHVWYLVGSRNGKRSNSSPAGWRMEILSNNHGWWWLYRPATIMGCSRKGRYLLPDFRAVSFIEFHQESDVFPSSGSRVWNTSILGLGYNETWLITVVHGVSHFMVGYDTYPLGTI